MKTIILYATKYGCTKSLAERLTDLIGNAELYNLKSDQYPPLDQFDCIIIGSSIYAGMIRKEVKTFINQYSDELKMKKLGLFLSGLQEENAETIFKQNYPAEILNTVYAKGFLGASFDSKKASWFDKLILKAVRKSSDSFSLILEDNLNSFANEMKGAR